MNGPSLASDFEAYSQWRADLSGWINEYRQWLVQEAMNDPQRDLRLQQLLDRLAEDKLHVAFIAEFSRGKSELINAIFLSDLKQRLLPSTAGRTTMCPTELLYDPSKPPQIELLPIETRATNTSIGEYRKIPEAWTRVRMDPNVAESVVKAMHQVCATKPVSEEEAIRYGLYDPNAEGAAYERLEDGRISIPVWRHAIINYPHPFLAKGLVVYDTPGLNAIGTEPELTFNLLPNAHAVLFVLAADAGVTKTDIEVWREHINLRGTQRGRLVALNKIDGLWDELKTEAQINAEIDKQVRTCAQLLGVAPEQIFPVSAQKGLLAKINSDTALLQKSRIIALEKALSEELIAAKQAIVRDQTEVELTDMLTSSRAVIASRLANLNEQLAELKGLQGKNQDVVEHIMAKIAQDKEAFERGLQQFQALRSIFSQQSIKLFELVGMDRLKAEVQKTRANMEQSRFTKGIREAMNGFFAALDGNLAAAAAQIDEIRQMMDSMYHKLNAEHGLTPFSVPPFSIERYQKEMQRLEAAYEHQINTFITMLTTEQHSLTRRFFETIANRAVQVFEVLNKEIEGWLRAVMAPMEGQIREHQIQLRRRLDSVKRIHKAADTLDERIAELDQQREQVTRQLTKIDALAQRLHTLLTLEAHVELQRAAA